MILRRQDSPKPAAFLNLIMSRYYMQQLFKLEVLPACLLLLNRRTKNKLRSLYSILWQHLSLRWPYWFSEWETDSTCSVKMNLACSPACLPNLTFSFPEREQYKSWSQPKYPKAVRSFQTRQFVTRGGSTITNVTNKWGLMINTPAGSIVTTQKQAT